MGTAKILRADGSIEELDHRPTLKEAQEIVGGYVELVHPTRSPGKTLVVDEEGKLTPKPLNIAGSRLYGGTIVGDIIVLEGWKTLG